MKALVGSVFGKKEGRTNWSAWYLICVELIESGLPHIDLSQQSLVVHRLPESMFRYKVVEKAGWELRLWIETLGRAAEGLAWQHRSQSAEAFRLTSFYLLF